MKGIALFLDGTKTSKLPQIVKLTISHLTFSSTSPYSQIGKLKAIPS